ncbi:DEBR0S3_14334g1_1 [Brettanomyces bruxellensis]|uniref:DEBR0S3_14334g1_1 n=1 Tax=Dekkera bruxellensis TaxID=5007 RepID=A0A7D9CZQ7_DEKBR|nr:DEBR0S3_14334g1_1 [Brettanomyces bruxellensis]
MPKRSRTHQNPGILSNSYVPPLEPRVLVKELARLSTKSLYNIVELWLALPVTQPLPTTRQKRKGKTQADIVKSAKEILKMLQNTSSSKKRKLIDRIMVDFYPNGLNTLQLAQLDIQLMIEKPKLYSWVYSTAKIAKQTQSGDELKDSLQDFILSLDAQSFLDHIIKNLSNLYLTHIYISRHPELPLIIIRIQMYEYTHRKHHKRAQTITHHGKRNNPDIISRKPYYLAIPTSSPNIIHSASNEDDLASKLILQAVEITLSTSFRQVRLMKNKNPPVKTLQAMNILTGVSRHGNMLGSWAPYADGIVDIGPLGEIEDHILLNPGITGSYDGKEASERENRKTIAALRFKGTTGSVPNEKSYSGKNNKPDTVIDEDKSEDDTEKNEYASVVPLQTGEFFIQNALKKKNNSEMPPSVRLRLFGNDIFAGLHELAVEGVIDPVKIPSWLTGEEGLNRGIISKGQFTKIE